MNLFKLSEFIYLLCNYVL